MTDEKTMAQRILNKQCPFCSSDDIDVDWIARTGKCNSCGASMRKKEAEKILRRAEIML